MNTLLPAIVTVSEARSNLYEMMEEVKKYLKRFTITHHGKPQAMILPIEDVESWEETLEILSDKKLMRNLRKAEKDIEEGRVYTLQHVEEKLLRKVSKKKK